MKRRAFLKSVAGIPVIGAGLGAAALARAADPWSNGTEWKTVEITTRVDLSPFQNNAHVWLPLPSVDTDYLKPLSNDWSGNASGMRIDRDPVQGAMLFHGAWTQPVDKPYVEVSSRFMLRDRAVDFAHPARPAPEERAVLEQYLQPTDFIPTDGIVRATALKCIGSSMGASDVDKARAIYEWIVGNTYRDGKVRGCGLGDIRVLLESGNLGGKCADLNSLFVGLARAVGIPARDVFGIRVEPSQWGYKAMSASGTITKSQHCRAEFYSASLGWVPVDPADVRKVVLEEPPGNLPLASDKVALVHKKLFGAWEMNWLGFNTAHDLKLPGAKGAAVPFLMYPQAELDGARKDSLDPDTFRYSIASRRLA